MIDDPAVGQSTDRAAVDLELKRLELQAKRRELDEKPQNAFWSSPLFLSVVTAVVGLLVNSALENQRAGQTRNLERRKEEASLILKAVESPDSLQRAANLKFFLDAGFVSDSSGQIRKAIDRVLGAGAQTQLPSIAGAGRQPGTYAQGVVADRKVTLVVLSDGTDLLDPNVAKRVLQDTSVTGSYHFLVDTSGVRHALVPETNVAYTVGRVGGVNRRAVSVGILHKLGQPFPASQIDGIATLVGDLLCRYRLPADSVQSKVSLLRSHNQPEKRTDLEPYMARIRQQATRLREACP